nr:MAG TPA: hypothetical protein [Caudoviricetes sp.]
MNSAQIRHDKTPQARMKNSFILTCSCLIR